MRRLDAAQLLRTDRLEVTAQRTQHIEQFAGIAARERLELVEVEAADLRVALARLDPGLAARQLGVDRREPEVGNVAVLHHLDLPAGRIVEVRETGRVPPPSAEAKPPRSFAKADMSTANDARFDAASKAPSPENESCSSAPGNVIAMSNENRPLVASALVEADCASSSKLIGSAWIAELDAPPPHPATTSAQAARIERAQIRRRITLEVGRGGTRLVLRSRDLFAR